MEVSTERVVLFVWVCISLCLLQHPQDSQAAFSVGNSNEKHPHSRDTSAFWFFNPWRSSGERYDQPVIQMFGEEKDSYDDSDGPIDLILPSQRLISSPSSTPPLPAPEPSSPSPSSFPSPSPSSNPPSLSPTFPPPSTLPSPTPYPFNPPPIPPPAPSPASFPSFTPSSAPSPSPTLSPKPLSPVSPPTIPPSFPTLPPASSPSPIVSPPTLPPSQSPSPVVPPPFIPPYPTPYPSVSPPTLPPSPSPSTSPIWPPSSSPASSPILPPSSSPIFSPAPSPSIFPPSQSPSSSPAPSPSPSLTPPSPTPSVPSPPSPLPPSPTPASVSILGNLTISGAELVPKFDPYVFNYTASFGAKVRRFYVTAYLPKDEEDYKLSLLYIGNVEVNAGERSPPLKLGKRGETVTYKIFVKEIGHELSTYVLSISREAGHEGLGPVAIVFVVLACIVGALVLLVLIYGAYVYASTGRIPQLRDLLSREGGSLYTPLVAIGDSDAARGL